MRLILIGLLEQSKQVCVCVGGGGGGSAHITNRLLRARRALSIFKDVPLRTRRVLSLYKVYGDSALTKCEAQGPLRQGPGPA